MTIELRGLCWDHPRCTEPMAAAAAAYPGEITVSWDARPLAAFNDQPVWEIEPGYDLIFVDHPMVGAIAERAALVPLDTVLDAATMARIAAGGIGASQDSYHWDGHHWALAVDAASQVAAVHTERLGATPPRTWDDVLALARRAPGSVALPLYPSDAICTLMSLSANAGEHWLHPDGAELLAELAGLVDERCFELNPPGLLDEVAAGGPVAYVPFVFGYANLARPPLEFTDVPGIDGRPRGAVLGGAGLAVLPDSSHVAEAAAFAAWCLEPTVQRDVLLEAGGQPGSRAVWDEPGDGSAARFLASTRRTIDQAYLRPRDPWWPAYQREAGILLVGLLKERVRAQRIVAELSALADRHRSGVAVSP